MAAVQSELGILRLDPAQIPGATTPVISSPESPPGVPVVGLPQSLFKLLIQTDSTTGAVQVAVAPPLHDVDGHVAISLWLDGVMLENKPIAPTDQDKVTWFDLFQSVLRDGRNNILTYKIHRLSGNDNESVPLWILYSAELPGGNNVPGTGEHPYLEINLPPELGEPPMISKEEVDQGVPLTLFYPFMKPYDVITLELNRERFTFKVQSGQEGQPYVMSITRPMFELAGNSPVFPISCTVVDQLNNPTDKRRWSRSIKADVDSERVKRTAPKVMEAEDDQETLHPIKAQDTLTVLVPQGDLLPSDFLSVTFTGAPDTPAGGSYTTPARPISEVGLTIALPTKIIAFNLGKAVMVTYTILRGIGPPLPSQPLLLNVQALPQLALGMPRLKDAANDGEGLELNLADLTSEGQMWFDDWPFIALGQYVWLTLIGTLSNDDAYERQFWAAPDAQTNEDWIAKGYFEAKALYEDLLLLKVGSTFSMQFKVGFDGSTDERKAVSFPTRKYNVTSVRLDIAGHRSQGGPHYHSNLSRLVASASAEGTILWTYTGDTEGMSGEAFLDECPEKSLIVTVLHEGKTLARRVLRPSNITGVFNLAGRHGGCITKDNGSVFGWSDNTEMLPPPGVMDVRYVTAGGQAFAALKKDATVVAWGAPSYGGIIPLAVERQLNNVKKLAATAGAFVALREDGSLVAWGNPDFGGVIPASIVPQLTFATQIIGNTADFSVLLRDGRLFSWGGTWPDGQFVAGASGATRVFASDRAFCALKANHSVFAWGSKDHGGTLPDNLVKAPADVTFLASSSAAFAALKADGSVTAWGNQRFGGEAPSDLQSVSHLVGSTTAFCALKADGTLVAWGEPGEGGKVPAGLRRALSISASYGSFTAVLDNHLAVSWGVNTSSPSQTPVACAYSAGPHVVLLSAEKTLLAAGPGAPDLEVLSGEVSYTE